MTLNVSDLSSRFERISDDSKSRAKSTKMQQFIPSS